MHVLRCLLLFIKRTIGRIPWSELALLLFLEIVALTVHNLLFSSTKENVRDIGCLSCSLVVLGGQSLPGVRAMTVPSFEIVKTSKTQPGLRSWVASLLSGYLKQ